MKTWNVKITLLALAASLPAQVLAAQPVILAVDGIDPAACTLPWQSPREGYLRDSLGQLCNGSCGEFKVFDWNRDITNSRAAVEALKARINEVGAEAANPGNPRPFVIVAHSWGGVLTGEALAELGNDLPFRISKVVTVGTPLGNGIYTTMVYSRLRYQGFYEEPQPAPSVDVWVNFWLKRDPVSSPLSIRDMYIDNRQLDSDPSFDQLEADINGKCTGLDSPYCYEAIRDGKVMASNTDVWHSAYFTDFNIPLNSVGQTLRTGWMTQLVMDEISNAR